MCRKLSIRAKIWLLHRGAVDDILSIYIYINTNDVNCSMEPVHPVSSVYLVNSALPTCLTVLYLLGAACISCFVHFVPSFPKCTAVIIITKNENDDNNHHRLLRNGGEKSVICSHRHVMPGGCVNTWLTSLCITIHCLRLAPSVTTSTPQ